MSDVIENSTVNEQTGVANPADAIAEMIAANRRNNPRPDGSQPPPAGQEEAKAESPEAAPVEEAEPENVNSEDQEAVEQETEEESSEEENGANEPVNFFDFAEQNPDLKIRIPNKNADGGFVEITAKKAATLLGQTSDIDENSRKLKLQRAEFEEFESKRRQELDGLQIGLELTIAPQLQQAADELVTLQQYNQQWSQIRDSATDEIKRSEAEAAIRQNQQLIEEKSKFIQTNRPRYEHFIQQRSEYVKTILEQSRQSFTDKELANKVVFNELREKLGKEWKGATGSFVPGVQNIDLLSSDEYILGLIRDGMKFREGPKVKNAGGSLAAANKVVAKAKTVPADKTEELKKRSAAGDKSATRDLLATMLAANKRR
jgi:hypothetical protein